MADSSSYGMHFKCPYSEHVYKYGAGTGLVGKEDFTHTTFGTASHDVVEGLLIGKPVEGLLSNAQVKLEECEGKTPDGIPRKQEFWWLLNGIVKSFSIHHLPLFKHLYEIIVVEQELVTELSPQIYWCCRPDLIVKRKGDEQYFNGNIKSTGYIKDLATIYEFSVQMLMESHAVKLSNNLDTAGSIILALSKGQKGKLNSDDMKAGREGYRMESPFTYVWWKKGTYSFTWAAGSTKVGVWEFNTTPQEWYEKIPVELAKAQVEFSTPINHHSRMKYEDIVKDILFVETCCAEGRTPKAYDSCNSYGTYNKPCSYKLWCYGSQEEIKATYVARTSNHPFEETLRSLDKEEF
jgi:hypothetical protein